MENNVKEMWIARDDDGILYLYDKKPKCLKDDWGKGGYYMSNLCGEYAMVLPTDMCSDITFGNGSIKVKITIEEV